MSVSGAYTREDLVSGAWLHVRRRLATAGALVVLLSFSFLSASSGQTGFASGIPEWALWVPPVAVLYLALLILFGIPYRCRRELAQRKDFQRSLTLLASETGLSVSTEVLASSRPWSDYSKWMEGKKVFNLYLSDTFFQVVPKRFFASDTDIEAFRELLQRRIPPRVV